MYGVYDYGLVTHTHTRARAHRNNLFFQIIFHHMINNNNLQASLHTYEIGLLTEIGRKVSYATREDTKRFSPSVNLHKLTFLSISVEKAEFLCEEAKIK